jgi:protein phosphatase PTC1
MDPPHTASNDGDAVTEPTTTTKGADTHGVRDLAVSHATALTDRSAEQKLNVIPLKDRSGLKVGIHEDKGKRRTMEDAHSFIYDYAGVRGQGFFAVFDGHAGKDAAEWCGFHFHEVRRLKGSMADPWLTWLQYLLETLKEGKSNTIPDALNQAFHLVDGQLSQRSEQSEGKLHSGCTAVTSFLRIEDPQGGQSFLPADAALDAKKVFEPKSHEGLRRVLYCANAGDARGVLCRGGKAVRLTYDHKGSDKQEAKRITDAGGFMMSGRVNGVLAVTRSLGDSSMKDFVVGSPYTTETELCDDDEFMIIACDGVSRTCSVSHSVLISPFI